MGVRLFFLLAGLAILLLFLSEIVLGSVSLDIYSIIDAIWLSDNEVNRNIIVNFRMPKALTAMLAPSRSQDSEFSHLDGSAHSIRTRRA